jgi:hypothetical protein
MLLAYQFNDLMIFCPLHNAFSDILKLCDFIWSFISTTYTGPTYFGLHVIIIKHSVLMQSVSVYIILRLKSVVVYGLELLQLQLKPKLN